MHDQLVLNLAEIKLEIVSDELLPAVFEVKENVLADVLLRGSTLHKHRHMRD